LAARIPGLDAAGEQGQMVLLVIGSSPGRRAFRAVADKREAPPPGWSS